jgi:pimeloyl-ACP methyl ester carboxylesterase
MSCLSGRAPPNAGEPLSHWSERERLAMFRIRWLHIFLTILVVSAMLGTTNVVAQDATPAAGKKFARKFDIGGRSLFLNCQGAGSPTVILEHAGYYGGSGDYTRVLGRIAEFTRVCTYDRANTLGDSDAAPVPRSGADVVNDLHALLAAAEVPGPYVMVGLSIGGLFARLYASTYPDEVVGMVLLETVPEEYESRTREMVGPDLWAAYEALWEGNFDPERFYPTGLVSDELEAEVRAARQASPLRPMPLVVVTLETPESTCDEYRQGAIRNVGSCFPPDWPIEEDIALWRSLQEELAALVPGGRVLLSTQNEHLLPESDPVLVVDAIRQVVDAVRDPSTWPAPTTGTPAA